MDNKFEQKSVEQIIDSLNDSHYEKEIEEKERAMAKATSKKEKEKIKSDIEYYKEKQKRCNRAISQLRSSLMHLDRIAQEDELLRSFERAFSQQWGDREFELLKFYRSNAYSKYFIISKKDIEEEKAKKEFNKLVEKNGWVTRLEFKLEDNHYFRLNIISSEALSQLREKYSFYEKGDLFPKDLGVDTEKLESALNALRAEPDEFRLIGEDRKAVETLRSLKALKDKNYSTKHNKSLEELIERYSEIVELSQENRYAKEVLEAFEHPHVTTKEFEKAYEKVTKLVKEQDKKLESMLKKANALYEKSGLESKIKFARELLNLYNKKQDLEYRIRQCEKNKNWDEYSRLQSELSDIKSKMYIILKDNPELNKSEYGINLDKKKKKDIVQEKQEVKKDIVQEEQKKETPKQEPTPVKETREEKKNPIDTTQPIDTTITQKEVTQNKTVTLAVKEQPKTKEELEKIIYEFDNSGSSLRDLRSQLYHKFMGERMRDSSLLRMNFSEYLEKRVPKSSEVKEIIKMEKIREELAKNIYYKEYLKYCASVEDKTKIKKWDDYVWEKYNEINLDLPVDAEEYGGMKK